MGISSVGMLVTLQWLLRMILWSDKQILTWRKGHFRKKRAQKSLCQLLSSQCYRNEIKWFKQWLILFNPTTFRIFESDWLRSTLSAFSALDLGLKYSSRYQGLVTQYVRRTPHEEASERVYVCLKVQQQQFKAKMLDFVSWWSERKSQVSVVSPGLLFTTLSLVSTESLQPANPRKLCSKQKLLNYSHINFLFTALMLHI